MEIYYKVHFDAKTYGETNFLGARPLIYASGKLRVVLHPRSQMTWKMWEEVVVGILAFGVEYEEVELDFDVYSKDLDTFYGTGVVTQLLGEG